MLCLSVLPMDSSEENPKPLSFPRASDFTQHDSRSSLNVTTTISQDRSEEFDLVTNVKIAEGEPYRYDSITPR